MARIQLRRKQDVTALFYLNKILKQPEVYNYYTVKLLHAEVKIKLNRPAAAHKDYQEILISNPPSATRHKFVYPLTVQC